MVAMRMSCEAAPPVDPSKQRNISQPSGATCGNHSTSQALVNMLRKFRPCPQSESGEDSCFDPRTPSPPSSTNSADEDCAVDIVNLECAQPLAYRTPAVPLPSRTNLNLHDDDDAIPSAQPCPDRPPNVLADPPALPSDPVPTESEVDDPHDTSQDLLIPLQELAKLTEFRSLWAERFNSEHSWDEFSRLCESFATEARTMAYSLSNLLAPAPAAGSNPPPPPCPPP